MIAVELSKGPFPQHKHLFNDYISWAARNCGPDPVFMIQDRDVVCLGVDSQNITMSWTDKRGEAKSGVLAALFFELAGPINLNDFL